MNNEIDPKITIFALMIIPLSLIGMEQDAQAQTITTTTIGDSFTTGSVSLDRTVYPVPFGVAGDPSHFPLHSTAEGDESLSKGDLSVHIRVNDTDFNVNPSSEDNIAVTGEAPVTASIHRGSSSVEIAHIGNSAYPMPEIGPDFAIFEYDLTIQYDDGPAEGCPSVFNGAGCILKGDILQIQYTDPSDASGDSNTVTASATFDLGNGVLQSDKSVYIIGTDMILTLIEPDFDLDSDSTETYDLDLIEWDSDAATVSMGERGGEKSNDGAAFDPEPTAFRETGDSTGIFQVVIEIPQTLDGDPLERGEEIVLEYTDWGPSGSDYVGQNNEDVNLTVYTSNFGATVELDQKIYTWTDKVYITIIAPDHNFDSDSIDEIGDPEHYPLRVSTRGAALDNYKLVETGTDTGIFTGEVILTGFPHDADGDSTTGDDNGNDITSSNATGSGPTDGLLPAYDDDVLTVSYEFSEDETVVGSALIRWNIGEVQWLGTNYPANGTGVIRVIDPDMNLDPEAVDNFDVDVWSDSDAGGIDLTVFETNEATGIFEGLVFFTINDESSGHRLRIAEGDTVTAEYADNTRPDPYTTADERDINATSLIGTVVPPLEAPPAQTQTITTTTLAPFVDESKDPQSYVDRYNNEPKYKKWFDENYPQYDSIYQAVGLQEPLPEWIKNSALWYGQGEITDKEFLDMLRFLIDSDIITPSDNSRFEDRINALELQLSEAYDDGYDDGYDDKLDMNKHRKMTYSYKIPPILADEKIIRSAISSAFLAWDRNNPNLKFSQVESGADITIKFGKHVRDGYGHAPLLCYSNCEMYVSFGVNDLCYGRWSHQSEGEIRDTVMHELGHILGLRHTSDMKHLMGAPDGVKTFDDLGFNIPERIPRNSTVLEERTIKELNMQYQRIERILESFGLTVEGYFENGERSTHPNFDNRLVPAIQSYNVIIDKIPCLSTYDNDYGHLKKYEFLR